MIIYFAHNAPWESREEFVSTKVEHRLLSYYYIMDLIKSKNFNPLNVVRKIKNNESK